MTEDRFTRKSEFQMHPEYWHSPDSESTETEVTELVAAFVRALQPEFVLETGTAHGHTAYAIGLALLKNGHGRLHTIENNKEMYDSACQLFDNPIGVMLPVSLVFENTMKYVPPTDIDFAFFDSWQEGRAEEFLRFYNMDRLKSGTIVAFHDTAPHHQVMKYVQPLVDGYIRIIHLRTPRGIVFGEVL